MSFSKPSMNVSQIMLFLTISFIVLTIFCINNNSFAIENPTIKNENEFNIIATADIGCSIRAQENIKNIENVLDTQLELSVDSLESTAIINETTTAATPTPGNDKLKVIDYFTIIK